MKNELVGNVIEQAIKVTSFRKTIREACRKAKLEYPSDEKIAEWIEQGYLFNVEDFISDYKEHKGIFRTPLMDFKNEIAKNTWASEITEDEIINFFNKHGNDVALLHRQHIINNMKPLERKIYLKTIEALPIGGLVVLWNMFIEESGIYGEDSCIYDLNNKEDWEFLREHMDVNSLIECGKLHNKGFHFIQWLSMSNESINGVSDNDIENFIIGYWTEIFERIMLFPTCYEYLSYNDKNEIKYFDEIVWPIIIKELGIQADFDNGKIKYSK